MKKILLAALIVLSLGSSVSFADDRDWQRDRNYGHSDRRDYGRGQEHHWYYRHRPYFGHYYRHSPRFYHPRHHGYGYRPQWHR